MRGGCRILFTGPDPPPKDSQGEGVEVGWLPLISIEPVGGSSLKLLEALEPGGLVVVTSPRTPRFLVLDALAQGVLGEVLRAFRYVTVAVVGERTGGEVRRLLGAEKLIVASGGTVESLASTLAGMNVEHSIILRASTPSQSYERLREVVRGAREVVVYRNRALDANARLLGETARRGLVDVVALSSPLQARALKHSGGLGGVRIVAIGPPTARAVEEVLGVKPIVAERPSIQLRLAEAVGACRGY